MQHPCDKKTVKQQLHNLTVHTQANCTSTNRAAAAAAACSAFCIPKCTGLKLQIRGYSSTASAIKSLVLYGGNLNVVNSHLTSKYACNALRIFSMPRAPILGYQPEKSWKGSDVEQTFERLVNFNIGQQEEKKKLERQL